MHTKRSNPALNLAPFGRWTLRDKAAQRRLALRSGIRIMKNDMSWGSTARPLFRILAIPLVCVFYLIALLMLFEWVHDCRTQGQLLWTRDLKVAIPGLFWAIFFTYVIFRGKGIFKKRTEPEP